VERRVLIALVVCLVACGVLSWVRVIDPARRHTEFCRVTRAELEVLTRKRPPNITRKQWHHIVAWTFNAHGNCLTFSPNIPQPERDRFVGELRGRLRGPVNLRTVDWIWDEFVRLAPSVGSSYSEQWRPTSPEKLREFEESHSTWVGVEVE
jgi:hypothetical protein